jgi:hypothetical protein
MLANIQNNTTFDIAIPHYNSSIHLTTDKNRMEIELLLKDTVQLTRNKNRDQVQMLLEDSEVKSCYHVATDSQK